MLNNIQIKLAGAYITASILSWQLISITLFAFGIGIIANVYDPGRKDYIKHVATNIMYAPAAIAYSILCRGTWSPNSYHPDKFQLNVYEMLITLIGFITSLALTFSTSLGASELKIYWQNLLIEKQEDIWIQPINIISYITYGLIIMFVIICFICWISRGIISWIIELWLSRQTIFNFCNLFEKDVLVNMASVRNRCELPPWKSSEDYHYTYSSITRLNGHYGTEPSNFHSKTVPAHEYDMMV